METVFLPNESVGRITIRKLHSRGDLYGRFGKIAIAITTACLIADVQDMYHMWLGPNGLPISPRKQRSKLFEFCTTHFVTEAESRYCFARLLSVGNPSGPVKYAGQPQYDSEQIVSPLFTFAMPAGSQAGGPAPAPAAPAPAPAAAAKSKPMMLHSFAHEKGASAPALEPVAKAIPALSADPSVESVPSRVENNLKAKLSHADKEAADLKHELHILASKKKAIDIAKQLQEEHTAPAHSAHPVAAVKPAPIHSVAAATPVNSAHFIAAAKHAVAHPAAAAKPAAAAAKPAAAAAKPAASAAKPAAAATVSPKALPLPATAADDQIRSRLSAAAAQAARDAPAAAAAERAVLVGKRKGLNSVFYLGSSQYAAREAELAWYNHEKALGI